MMRKKMKRFLAVLLILSITFSYHVQALAAAGSDSAQAGYFKSEQEKAKQDERKASPLYNQLIHSGAKPKPLGSLLDEGEDWAEEYRQKTVDAGIDEALGAIGDAARYRMNHIYKRSPHYYDTKGAFEDLANVIEAYGSLMGVHDAISLFPDIINLQADTVGEQLMEVALLTAEFGIAAFSVIGLTIGFPWGMILSLVLDLILDMIRNGAFDGIFNNPEDYGDRPERERYKLPDGTRVYKPNLYVYSEEKREVTVTFEEPELLTVTIPEYRSCWQVTADAQSHLTDAAGGTYDYLFYESVTEPYLFKTEAGWRIPAGTRKESLERIVSGLGFNEKEREDFTEFWTEKLDPGVDYLMYPQNTARVDLAMPVTIAETPESLERIWFVFMRDDGQPVQEPEGYELSRGGEGCSYYVIEWGGLILQ